MQIFGLFKNSVNIHESHADPKNKKSFKFEFKKTPMIKNWSRFLIFLIVLIGVYHIIETSVETFIATQKKYGFSIAYFFFETYIILLNIIIYFETYKKTGILRSILKFQSSLPNMTTKNEYKTFLKSVSPLTVSIFISVCSSFYDILKNYSDTFTAYLDYIINYTLPFFKYNLIIAIFSLLALNMANIYNIRVNNFENILYKKHYSNKNVFDERNVAKILGNHLIVEKDEIYRILANFSVKLYLLNINQNKFNDYFGTIISCLMSESIFWLVFGPFKIEFSGTLDSIFKIFSYFTAPLAVLIICCTIPEFVLTKVSSMNF